MLASLAVVMGVFPVNRPVPGSSPRHSRLADGPPRRAGGQPLHKCTGERRTARPPAKVTFRLPPSPGTAPGRRSARPQAREIHRQNKHSIHVQHDGLFQTPNQPDFILDSCLPSNASRPHARPVSPPLCSAREGPAPAADGHCGPMLTDGRGRRGPAGEVRELERRGRQ